MTNKKLEIKFDEWGIMKGALEIYSREILLLEVTNNDYNLAFYIFFTQFLPDPWKESRGTIIRHYDEIVSLLHSDSYDPSWCWIKFPKLKNQSQIRCNNLTQILYRLIKSGERELATYLEIEKQKNEWQAHPSYRKDEGFTTPIIEEVVQLKINKRRQNG